MNEQDIINFKNSLCNLTIDELIQKRDGLQQEISQMLLNCDAVVKTALIESLLKEKIEKESNNGKISNRQN
jgi:hypothetical protein